MRTAAAVDLMPFSRTCKSNAETRDRTGDLQIFSLTLSQLSYRGTCTAKQSEARAEPTVRARCWARTCPSRPRLLHLCHKRQDIPEFQQRVHCQRRAAFARKHEAREIRTPNFLIWSQTRCRCAIAPLELNCLRGACEALTQRLGSHAVNVFRTRFAPLVRVIRACMDQRCVLKRQDNNTLQGQAMNHTRCTLSLSVRAHLQRLIAMPRANASRAGAREANPQVLPRCPAWRQGFASAIRASGWLGAS